MKRRFFCDKLVFSLILLLLTSRIASAMSIVTAKKCPIYLVMEEKDGTISQAYLGTPAGSHQIKSIEGYVLTQQEMISTKVNKGSRCFLWRLSFTKPDNPAELMQVWIAYIQEKKIIEVASGKSRRNEWSRAILQLPLPEGVFLFISCEPDGDETSLSNIFTITLTSKGLTFTPVAELYQQLIPLAITFAQSKGIFENERTQKTIGTLTQLAQGENVDNIAKMLNLKKEFKITW